MHYLDTDGSKTLDYGIFKNFRFAERNVYPVQVGSVQRPKQYQLQSSWQQREFSGYIRNHTAAQPARTMQFGLKFYY